MKINRVTITGADDAVSWTDLADISAEYPFVEWGILFNTAVLEERRTSYRRYPEKIRIDLFATHLNNLSAHLCGKWAREILENCRYELITGLDEAFKRVQINYNFDDPAKFNLINFIFFVEKHPERDFILQFNHISSRELKQVIAGKLPSNLHFLYDNSRGGGVEMELISGPLGSQYTGYAGGINNKNIDSICARLGRFPDNSNVWIDIETGARQNDQFNLDTVKLLLHQAEYFVEK